MAPNKPENPVNLPSIPDTTAISLRATPIPVRPLAIPSHDIEPIFFIASAMSDNPCTVSRIVPAPIIPEKPANLPTRPDIRPSSPRASPIPAKPLAMSSHDIKANFIKALTMVSNPDITIRIAPAPNILEKPANFPTAVTTVAISPKATPIPVRPFLITSQLMKPNFLRVSAIVSSPWVTINIAPAPNILEKPASLPIAVRDAVNSVNAPPIPTSPLAIPSQFISPNLANPEASLSND